MILREKALQFDFDEAHWSCLLKFDESTDYKKTGDSLPNTKAVDFAGIFKGQSLILMEVKDFRGNRVKNKPKLSGRIGSLWLDVAKKNKDSIAVIIGAARNSTHEKDKWQSYLEILKNEKKSLHLILWLEQDQPLIGHKANQKKGREEHLLQQKLKRSPKWLTPKVQICDIFTNPFGGALKVNYL